MDHSALIDAYLAGPQQLCDAIAGMTDEQINAAPVPGKWSTRQVICHIADFEPVYVDRIKRRWPKMNRRSSAVIPTHLRLALRMSSGTLRRNCK